jgi:hypothetical protein
MAYLQDWFNKVGPVTRHLLLSAGLVLVAAGIFLVIPLAMFGVAVGGIFFSGSRDQRKRRSANSGDARPHRAA